MCSIRGKRCVQLGARGVFNSKLRVCAIRGKECVELGARGVCI